MIAHKIGRYIGVLFVAVLLAAGISVGKGAVSVRAACGWRVIAEASYSIPYYNLWTGHWASVELDQQLLDDCQRNAFGRTHVYTTDGYNLGQSTLYCREGWDFGPYGGMKGQTVKDATGQHDIYCQDGMPIMAGVPGGSAPWTYSNGFNNPGWLYTTITTPMGVLWGARSDNRITVLAQWCCY